MRLSSSRPLFVCSLVVLVALLAPAPSGAQPEEVERHGIFIDSIEVNLVNLEVMAFDAKGNPVTDLEREDFTVLEDGEVVPITNFHAVEDGEHRIARDPVTGLPVESFAEETEEAPSQPTLAQGRYLVLFVDNDNITPNHRRRVFAELKETLEELIEPVDQVLVAEQSRRVHIVQPFTSQQELVASALDELEKATGVGARHLAEQRRLDQLIERGNAPGTGPGGTGEDFGLEARRLPATSGPTPEDDARNTIQELRSYAHERSDSTRRTLSSLRRFVNSLAGLPGRKAVLYISDGLELSPGDYLFRKWERRYQSVAQQIGVSNIEFELSQYDLGTEFRDLIADANANRVAFYTLEGGRQGGGGDRSATSRIAAAPELGRTADGGRRSALTELAHSTGGAALLGQGNVPELLQQLERDFDHYYSIGYSSPHHGDGKYHRVKVEVEREGVTLRYLAGYRAKSAGERMEDRTLASLLFDVGENPLGVKVEIGEQESAGRGQEIIVPVLVKIPLSNLVLLPQEDVHRGQLAIYVAVQDSQGRMVSPKRIDVPVEIPNDQLLSAMTRTAGYLAQLRMRPGEQKLAIGVRDELASVRSTLNLNVDVGGE